MADYYNSDPFGATADPKYFYVTHPHRQMLHRLWTAIDRSQGICVVLGDYGSGKTSLMRKIATSLKADSDKYCFGIIPYPLPSWSSLDLLRAICVGFEISIPEDVDHDLLLTLLQTHFMQHSDLIRVLLIDEAQHLNKHGQIEVLRLLQELETPDGKLLNLLFFGHLSWRKVLQAAPAFEHRTGLIARMQPVPFEETRAFLQHRLTQAGDTDDITVYFDDDSLREIHAYASGNPRRMVILCRQLCITAEYEKKDTVTKEMVEQTISETTLEGLLANSEQPIIREWNVATISMPEKDSGQKTNISDNKPSSITPNNSDTTTEKQIATEAIPGIEKPIPDSTLDTPVNAPSKMPVPPRGKPREAMNRDERAADLLLQGMEKSK